MKTTPQIRRIFAELLRKARQVDPSLRVALRVGRASEFPELRDHAYCSSQRGRIEIVIAPRMLSAAPERQAGVLAHELGHALLFRAGLPEHAERSADEVAERAMGKKVRYDSEDVQTFGRGKKVRPSYLPR